jgi:NO-binding membrane sensor protein with MHYT domain
MTLLGLRLESDLSVVSAPLEHDRGLVLLSILTCLVAVYAMFELAERANTLLGAGGLLWRVASGAMIAVGVWSAHFIGLLAIESPLMRGIEPLGTAGSGLIALAGGALTFVIAGPRPHFARYAAAGAISAIAGVVMHYWGMAALRIDAELGVQVVWAASIMFGAFLGTMATLYLAYRSGSTLQRIVWSFPVAALIASLHYLNVAATILTPRPDFLTPAAALQASAMAEIVAGAAAILAAVAIWLAFANRAAPSPPPRRPQEKRPPQGRPQERKRAEDEETGVVIIPSFRSAADSDRPR